MKRKVYITFSVIALVAIILAIVFPLYNHVPIERRAGSELYSFSRELRSFVEEAAKLKGSLNGSGNGFETYTKVSEEFGKFDLSVTNDGVISGVHTEFELRLVLTPTLEESSVKWNCKFAPSKFGPSWCRE